MTFGDFAVYQAFILERVTTMVDTKGREYANSEDNRFANFDRLSKEISEELGYDLPNYVVAYIFFKKHLDSIKSYIRNRGKGVISEPINGRFVDAITYMTLIGGMIEEGEKMPSLNGYIIDHWWVPMPEPVTPPEGLANDIPTRPESTK